MENANYLDGTTKFAHQILSKAGRDRHLMKSVCYRHQRVSPVCVCATCQVPLCRDCVKTVGLMHAFVCVACGSHCFPFQETLQKVNLLIDQKSPFGFADLKMALMFPGREAIALVLLSLAYGVSMYTIPFFAISLSGSLFGVLGLLPAVIGTSILLGSISTIIERVEQGGTDNRDAFDIVAMLANIPDTVARGFGIFIALFWPISVLFAFGATLTTTIPIFLCWVALYYPLAIGSMALKHGVFAAINPINGIRIIYELGRNCISFFAFYLVIAAISAGLIVAMFLRVLPYLELNVVGSLAFMLPSSLIICYANVVIAVILGRAIFKAGWNRSA